MTKPLVNLFSLIFFLDLIHVCLCQMVVLDTRYALHTVKYFEPPYQCVKDLRALAPGDDGARYQIFFHLL